MCITSVFSPIRVASALRCAKHSAGVREKNEKMTGYQANLGMEATSLGRFEILQKPAKIVAWRSLSPAIRAFC